MHTANVQTALITGGASGMGRAAGRALSLQGIRVLIADLNLDRAREAADGIQQDGGAAEAFQVDISQSSSVRALFERLKNVTETLDMFAHTAAILGETASLEEVDDEAWRRMMAVNLDGVFFCCREAVRWMKETGGGRILLFSSVASLTPTPGAIPYSAAKGAVNMLAKSLAAEAAKHNVRVNVIAPGYIRTPMLEGLPDGFEDYIVKKTPLKRLGEVDEMSALVAFLASHEADFFTGQIFSPNGGLVI
jgi:3-oxoacyl-[acyl-carrier protein] reductase